MKKLFALMMAAVMIFSLCACGGGTPAKVTATDNITIDGLYVDSSYKDRDSDALKLLYVFYTVTATDTNLKLDSKSSQLTFADTNSYDAYRIPDAAKYAPNYYYSDYLEDVYTGSSFKIVETFKVPEGDLAAGKTITVKNSDIPGCEELRLSTDDIITCESAKEIAKAVDPEGYEKEVKARKEADDATKNKVKRSLNGYYFTFYTNNTSYKLEFFSPNKFEITTLGMTNSGKYMVRNDYIFLKYSSNDYVVEIPYDFNSAGEIELDVAYGFDVREN